MALNLSFMWSNFSLSIIAGGLPLLAKCKGWGSDWYWDPLEHSIWGHQKMSFLQWYIWGGGQNRLECGLGELHMFPPWIERYRHDQVGAVDSHWVWVQNCWYSHQERIQRWVVYNWEANHMAEGNACSKPEHNGAHLHFLLPHLLDLLHLRLDDSLDWNRTSKSAPSQW